MGELFKSTYTIDDMLEKMGVQIVLDGKNLSEEDKATAEKMGDIVEEEKDEKKKMKSKKKAGRADQRLLFC